MNLSEILERNSRMYPKDTALIEQFLGKSLRRQMTWNEFDERVPHCFLLTQPLAQESIHYQREKTIDLGGYEAVES